MIIDAPVQAATAATDITYPESDGKPIAENTKQFRWIVTIEGGLEALFRDDPEVFVAGDLLWYPVEGHPDICTAPDAMVVFGRPKGDRTAYVQFREGGIAPQVVFEVLSPGNTYSEMLRKLRFYERYGVEEYYVYDPDRGDLSGALRREGALEEIPDMQGWESPRLRVRFALEGNDLRMFRADGTPFASYLELIAQQEQAHQRTEEALHQAAEERRRTEEALQQAAEERQRTIRLEAQLRALGVEPAGA